MRLRLPISLYHCLRLKGSPRRAAAGLFVCAVLVTAVAVLWQDARASARVFAASPAGASTAATAEQTESGQQLKTLMYHHLLKRGENTRYQGNGIVTYTEDFESQLRWLSENGYASVTPAQVEEFLYNGQALPVRPVLITFDDGYLSNAVYAAPLLRQYGFTATVFLVTGKLSEASPAFQPDGIQMMSRAELESCADVFTYASHTNDLHQATGPSRSALTDSSAEAVRADLQKSLEMIRSLNGGCTTVFSYPYGFLSDRVRAELKAAGVRVAFRATGGTITAASDPFDLPRYDISYRVTLNQFAEYMKTG